MAEKKIPEIDKEVFDTFFQENYCELEYKDVKKDFEGLAEEGLEYLFEDDTDLTKLTRKNFIVHMTMDAYGSFEEILEETTDSLNEEILDAVMDLGSTTKDAGEITGSYWDKNEELLKKFLRQLYDEKLEAMIKKAIED